MGSPETVLDGPKFLFDLLRPTELLEDRTALGLGERDIAFAIGFENLLGQPQPHSALAERGRRTPERRYARGESADVSGSGT